MLEMGQKAFQAISQRESGFKMYVYIDLKNQAVKDPLKRGVASKYALGLLGVPLAAGEGPVKVRGAIEGRGLIVSLSGAFESIAESGDTAAQELAAGFARAVDELYNDR